MLKIYFKFLIFALTSYFIVGCNDNSLQESGNLNVENYIRLLRAEQYDSMSVPAFTYQDIPALLSYRNEKQLISNFPRNPISSYCTSQCRLGIYVLWTIESIRLVSIGSKYLVMRFPLQNAILALKNSDFGLVTDDASHESAANAYYLWWESNRRRNFVDFAKVDPLATTNYKWH